MEHYYSKKPISDLNESIIDRTIAEIRLHLHAGSGVFSRNGIDFGSRLLIEAFLIDYKGITGKILDMGCGYGPIGIYIAAGLKGTQVDMADINERAVELAIKNIKTNNIKNAKAFVSDGYEGVGAMYDAIVTNPPIRAGKKTVFSFYEGAFGHLVEGGSFYCVIQKKQGAESSQKKLQDLFGNCEIVNRKSGYRILKSIK